MNWLGPARSIALVAAGAALVYGGAHTDGRLSWAAAPGSPGNTSLAAVARTQLLCPGPVDAHGAPGTVTLASAVAPDSLLPRRGGSGGAVHATRLPVAAGGAPRVATTPDAVSTDAVRGRGAVGVVGSGRDAQGLVATQSGLADTASGHGLDLVGCAAPGTDLWLPGGGAQPGRLATVVLTNPGRAAVSADVSVIGAHGVSPRHSAQSVDVPAGGEKTVTVGGLSASDADPMIHVQATGGVVGASVTDTWTTGETPSGQETTGATAAPALHQVIPAVVDLGAPPQVRIAVPGAADGIVQVQVVGTDGAIAQDRVATVPAGSSRGVGLSGLKPGSYSIRITSDEPVVAAAMFATGTTGRTDFAWMPAADPITQLSGFALPPGPNGGSGRLVLTAQGKRATATVDWADASGANHHRVVRLEGSTPVAVPVTGAASGWVRVTSGRVYAGLVQQGSAAAHLVAASVLRPLTGGPEVRHLEPAR